MDKSQVPVFILAGGLGTRLAEETDVRPKPMVEIGEFPILIHIMRWYAHHGFNDFVICAGYKSWAIKQYFLSYEFRSRHLDLDFRGKESTPKAFGEESAVDKWRVRVIETGGLTMTGGRVARAFDAIAATQKFDQFALTYGDGVSDANLTEEFAFHMKHGKTGTVLGVHPRARFGELDLDGNTVKHFLEKPQSRQGHINGGFFFFNKDFRKYLSPDESCVLERDPLEKVASDGGLQVFRHEGFWQPMDTLMDKRHLETLWNQKKAPWLPGHKG